MVAAAGAGALLLTAFFAACDNDTRTPPGTTGAGGSTSSSNGGSGGGDGGGDVACQGPEIPSEAYDADPGPVIAMGGAGGTAGAGGVGGAGGAGGSMTLGPKDVGADTPAYQLEDVHPLSCGYEGVYGLDQFRGKVTLAALWAGW